MALNEAERIARAWAQRCGYGSSVNRTTCICQFCANWRARWAAKIAQRQAVERRARAVAKARTRRSRRPRGDGTP